MKITEILQGVGLVALGLCSCLVVTIVIVEVSIACFHYLHKFNVYMGWI